MSKPLCELPPPLWPGLLPDLGGELQLDRVDVDAVPGAVDLSDPSTPVILVTAGGWLSE